MSSQSLPALPLRQRSESELFAEAADRGRRYLEDIRHRRVSPSNVAVLRLAQLPQSLPQQPTDSQEVLALLDDIGSPATVANAGGRYFGFVCGGALPAARAANVLAAAWDQNAAMSVLSPVAAELEQVALRWILDVLELPENSAGAFVTGGTMASFSCLAAARHYLLDRQGWSVENDGLFGAPSIDVYVSEHVHASVLKSLALLGLGKSRVQTLSTDGQGRIDLAKLPEIKRDALVCIQAGDVNSGAFDEANVICGWAHAAGAWVHVDGAFGLWATASAQLRYLTEGVSHADSWATDAHKWLNVPYDCGVAIVSRPEALRAAMSLQAAYLKLSADHRDPSDWNPELSRRARAVETWAALLSLGRSGLGALLEQTCEHARVFADGLRRAGFEILNDVVLNQVLVSFGDDELTEQVAKSIQQEGTCWCGTTIWKGRRAMRISVSSWATSEKDVEISLAAMVRIAHACKSAGEAND